jgi:hypothetical protein
MGVLQSLLPIQEVDIWYIMLSIEGKDQISALDDDMTTNRVNQFQQHAFS